NAPPPASAKALTENAKATASASNQTIANHLHDALELDLDALGKYFLAQDCPQLGVERAGVESVFAVVPVGLVRVPVGMFLNSGGCSGLARRRCPYLLHCGRLNRLPQPADSARAPLLTGYCCSLEGVHPSGR